MAGEGVQKQFLYFNKNEERIKQKQKKKQFSFIILIIINEGNQIINKKFFFI